MMRWIEPLVFLSLATAIHAGVWAVSPLETGAAASGGAGQAEATVIAANPEQTAMVARWQAPPVTTETAPALSQPARMMLPAALPDAPALPRTERPRSPQPVALTHNSPATPDAAPLIDTETAPPPPQPALAAPTRPKLRPESVTSAAAQPERQARGAARQAQAGQRGSDKLQSQANAQQQALRARWGAEIHAKIQRNLRYPRGTNSAGTTKLALTVAPNGTLQTLRLLRSSGDALLDRAALHAVERAGRFAKAPVELSEAAYAFSLSLSFRR